MKIALIVLFLANAVAWNASYLFPAQYRPDRSFERGGKPYDAQALQAFVQKDEAAARRYAFPVLFPYDLLCMMLLGAFLALASVTWSAQVPWLAHLAWLFVLAPALYLAVDLAEDSLLAYLLTHGEAIGPALVGPLQLLTKLKIVSFVAGVGQTAVLGLLALIYARPF